MSNGVVSILIVLGGAFENVLTSGQASHFFQTPDSLATTLSRPISPPENVCVSRIPGYIHSPYFAC